MARVVIATDDAATAARIAELLVREDVVIAGEAGAVPVLLEDDTVLLLDAATPWAQRLLLEIDGAKPATVVVVADPLNYEALPPLIQSGAHSYVTLPTDRIVVETAIRAATRSSRQEHRLALELQSARKQLMRFAEDFRDAYRREREKALALEKTLGIVERSYEATVRSLALAVESKDLTTGRHIERVTVLATALAEQVDPDLAAEPYLSFGFLLHDVGKIGVPDAVLTKQGPLDDLEFDAMREHPAIGARIVEGIEFLAPVRPIIRHHHERWDGRGYPDRLVGEDIPRAARIFSVADAADAMLHDRPYRAGLPVEQVRDELVTHAGTQFDPEVVDAFCVLLDSEKVKLGKGGG